MVISLNYDQAKTLAHLIKHWERDYLTAEQAEIYTDSDKIEWDRIQDKVEITIIP